MKYRITFGLFFFFCQFSFGQQNSKLTRADSLYNVLKNSEYDTLKAKVYTQLAEFYFGRNLDSMTVSSQRALLISEKNLKSAKGKDRVWYLNIKAEACNSLGVANGNSGHDVEAVEFYNKSLKIREEIGDKDQIANSLNNIGVFYDERGDASKALDYYLRCLKILEESKTEDAKYGMGFILNNIAFVYRNQKDIPKALDYFRRSNEIRKSIGDEKGIAECSVNIGSLLHILNDAKGAQEYYEIGLKIYEKAGYNVGITQCLEDIGRLYFSEKKYGEAKTYLEKALKYALETQDKGLISNGYLALADVELSLNQMDQALAHGKQSFLLAKEVSRPEAIRGASDVLSRIYEKKGDHKQSLEMFRLFVEMNDSIQSEQNQKASVQKEMQYIYDKKTVADSIRNAEQIRVEELKHEQEISRQRSYTYGGIIGFVLMLIIAIVSYKAFRDKRQSNKEIAEKKALLEEKQKEIIDSLTYAKRIQQSHMPTERYIQSNLERLKK